MIRVLHVFPQLNNAGTETVIMNLYNNIDRSIVQFDFLVEKPGELDQDIRALGGKIFYLKAENKIMYYEKVIEFFNHHPEYRIVHTHTHRNMGVVLKAANAGGVECRIAHSHTARTDLPDIVLYYKKITSRPIEKNATHFFACSMEAAKWLFPSKYSEAKIIYNAINQKKFIYNEKARKNFREKYNILKNEKVVCHVGRFSKEKNHIFILKIIQKILIREPDIKFLLVGTGSLENSIKDLARKYNIDEKIIFLGNRSDVNKILSGSDLFILPSLYEGLGIVLIEAQTNGLSCISSDRIPSEADLGLGLLERKSLSDQPGEWAEEILCKLNIDYNRKEISEASLLSRYNINNITKSLQYFYLSSLKK